jgi:hypothetical protein
MKTYYFCASSYGLENLTPVSEMEVTSISKAMNIACRANQHRFQLWGLIDLEDDVYKGLKDIMNMYSDGPKMALELVKKTQYSFSRENAHTFKRYMEKIPNDICE